MQLEQSSVPRPVWEDRRNSAAYRSDVVWCNNLGPGSVDRTRRYSTDGPPSLPPTPVHRRTRTSPSGPGPSLTWSVLAPNRSRPNRALDGGWSSTSRVDFRPVRTTEVTFLFHHKMTGPTTTDNQRPSEPPFGHRLRPSPCLSSRPTSVVDPPHPSRRRPVQPRPLVWSSTVPVCGRAKRDLGALRLDGGT